MTWTFKQEDKVMVVVRKTGWDSMDWTSLVVTGSCEHGDENSGPLKRGEFLKNERPT